MARTFNKNKKSKISSKKKSDTQTNVLSACPSDSHFVRAHLLHLPSSDAHPESWITTRRAHCARNQSKSHENLYFLDEVEEISKEYFDNAEPKPCHLGLTFKEKGTKYDSLIAGWTKYWNDIFQISDPLDPNFIKALIATESSFNLKATARPRSTNLAYGLMQVTEETRKIMRNTNGELKQHFISVTPEDLYNPNINICAGVRWIFHKRKLLAAKIGREPTWQEVVFDYKGGNSKRAKKEKMQEIMDKLSKYYEDFQKCQAT